MSGIAQTLRGLGTVHLTILGGVGIAVILFFIFLGSRLSGPNMALLFGELDVEDSGAIVNKLEAMNVPYELQGDGTRILVPADQVPRLRVALAEEGLPSGGSVGYEIFDRSETLGTTSFVQNINHVRALEGELARTIRSISGVKAARVHLVLPRQELFSRQSQEPSASVILKTRGPRSLSPTQVQAIQHLIAAAVPSLKPTKVSVIDDKGTLLARATDDDSTALLATRSSEMRQSYEDRLGRTIESLLERSVGAGKVRAKVTALMDFDRITTRSEVYDPEGQVVRSTQTVEEKTNSNERDGSSSVSVQNNLPDQQTQESGATSTNYSDRVEETVNYEISKTVTDHYRETGVLKRLSVAVLVDGTYTQAGDGARTYAPRSDTEIAKMERLVKSAIGYDETRGDTVEIVNMPFDQLDTAWEEEDYKPLFGLGKADYFRIAEILVLSIVALLVIMLVVRPLVARTLEALPKAEDLRKASENLLTDASGGPLPALPGNTTTANLPPAPEPESLINLEQVEGRVRASSIRKVGEIVQKHPEESVSILRNWLYQES